MPSRKDVPWAWEANPVTGAYIGPSLYVRLYLKSPGVATEPVIGLPPTMMLPRG